MEVTEKLKNKISAEAQSVLIDSEKRIVAEVESSRLRDVVASVLEEQARFMTLSASDEGLDFKLFYHFDLKGTVLSIIVKIPKEENEVPTVTDLVPGAQWAEREAADLFNIEFKNHPKPEKLILAKDWPKDKPPLRLKHKGELSPQLCPVAESLITSGLTAELSPRAQKNRKKSGLPPKPPATLSDEEASEELQTIMKESSFSEKAGYDWDKKKLRFKYGRKKND